MTSLFQAGEAEALLRAAINGELPDERGRFAFDSLSDAAVVALGVRFGLEAHPHGADRIG